MQFIMNEHQIKDKSLTVGAVKKNKKKLERYERKISLISLQLLYQVSKHFDEDSIKLIHRKAAKIHGRTRYLRHRCYNSTTHEKK